MIQLDGVNDDGTSGTDLFVDLQTHQWGQIDWACDYDYPEAPELITTDTARRLVNELRASGWRMWPECLPHDPERGRCYRSLVAMQEWDAWLDQLLAGNWAAPAPAWFLTSERGA